MRPAAFQSLNWEREDDDVECRLGTVKTQMAPREKITIPRIELVVAVNAVGLVKRIKEKLKMPIGYVLDPPSHLGHVEDGIRKVL